MASAGVVFCPGRGATARPWSPTAHRVGSSVPFDHARAESSLTGENPDELPGSRHPHPPLLPAWGRGEGGGREAVGALAGC
jgi:hypothetical protein